MSLAPYGGIAGVPQQCDPLGGSNTAAAGARRRIGSEPPRVGRRVAAHARRTPTL